MHPLQFTEYCLNHDREVSKNTVKKWEVDYAEFYKAAQHIVPGLHPPCNIKRPLSESDEEKENTGVGDLSPVVKKRARLSADRRLVLGAQAESL